MKKSINYHLPKKTAGLAVEVVLHSSFYLLFPDHLLPSKQLRRNSRSLPKRYCVVDLSTTDTDFREKRRSADVRRRATSRTIQPTTAGEPLSSSLIK